jgi:hypothetical protein
MSFLRSVPYDNTSTALTNYLPPAMQQAVSLADTAIRNCVQRVRLANWRLISTAPYNQELELRISDFGRPVTLEFPVLRTNSGAWINVDLGSEIRIEPLEWRIWQRDRSPQPHRSRIKANDRSALFRRSFALGYETA